MIAKLSVLKDASEIVHYDNSNIPIYIKTGNISTFTNMEALCHWHNDIEYLHVIKGHLNYFINGKRILIKENDAILVNSRQMHYGYSEDKTDCKFLCVLFKPDLISTNQEIKQKYIDPILNQTHITEDYLDFNNSDDKKIIQIFQRIACVNNNKVPGYELKQLSNLHEFWFEWHKKVAPYIGNHMEINPELLAQKQMVQYIYDNYFKKISLNDIAKAGEVCRSKCCQIFKKYLNKTPSDFLNTYRLEVSMNLLQNPELNITEIAFSCGFNSPSYYSELFLKYKGCTPSKYRLNKIDYNIQTTHSSE